MKKHAFTILIIIFCAIFAYLNLQKPEQYRVIKVFASDFLCIDVNNNQKCENTEKYKLFGITPFPVKFGKQTDFIQQRYSIEDKDSVVLGVMAKDYSSKNLLNKYVTIVNLDNKSKNYKIGKLYLNNTDYAQTLLKNGWAISPNNAEYKIYENMAEIKKNIKFSKNFNYQLKNLKNGKIHTLDCEYGRKASKYEIGIFDDEKYKKDYCNYCHNDNNNQKNKEETNFPKLTNYDYSNNNVKVYFSDFTKTLKPNSSCVTPACKNLLSNINNSKKSIDFAIYGMGKVPEIEKALSDASKRGVKIRYVFDEDSKKQNIYERTSNLTNILSDFKSDYKSGESNKFNNYIMHNKFFIFDDSIVWFGTANISETDLSGFSANNVIVIKSNDFAKIYKSEFEKMHKGSFHTYKTSQNKPALTIDNSEFKIFFSPQDKVISTYLNNLIKNAKKSIYIETFIITHKALANSLIEAHKKGVDIKIIVDATSASNNYSMVKLLRDNGIKVKVENYAGKMHMKTVLVDDDYFISGSANLTKSADQYNDENLVFIKNKQLTYNAKAFFMYLWSKIPDKYLNKNLSAESKESIGSCTDGVDNDYNGKVDTEDDKCK